MEESKSDQSTLNEHYVLQAARFVLRYTACQALEDKKRFDATREPVSSVLSLQSAGYEGNDVSQKIVQRGLSFIVQHSCKIIDQDLIIIRRSGFL